MAKKTSKSRYTCPFCFNEIDFNNVHYACTGRGCIGLFVSEAIKSNDPEKLKYVDVENKREIDVEKSMMFGSEISGPNAIPAKNHIIRNNTSGKCDICKRPLYTRVCPYCHNEIQQDAEENSIFVVLGPKGVGKSHYITVLIEQLYTQISKEFDATLSPANDETINKYRSKYRNILYDSCRKIPSTQGFEKTGASREPLIFHFRMLGGKERRTYTLVFFDTAGEDLVSLEKIRSLNIEPFISKASGIMFLVDPMQIKYVNDRINVDNKPGVGPDMNDFLNIICEVIRNDSPDKKSKGKFGIPLAVTFTKIDVLLKTAETEEERKVLIDTSSSIHIPREQKSFDHENFEQISTELEEYARRMIGEDFIQTVHNFEDYGFFATSALGYNPPGESLSRGITPIRVEDPFLWLLSREE